MMFEALLISTATLVVVYVLRGHREKAKKQTVNNSDKVTGVIPTVSPCLPYFGNALQLDMSRCHTMLTSFSKKYGPVFRIRLYKEEILVLNDYASIHDALVVKGSDFAGRPPMYRTRHADRNKHSIVWQTYTKKLVFLRKAVLRSLRMYGSGLEKLEERCEPDIRCMCDRLAAQNGQPVDPWDIIYDAVSSVMLSLTLGVQLSCSSPDFQCLKKINALFNDTFGLGRARRLDFIPLLRWLKDDCFCRMQEALALRDEFWNKQLEILKASGSEKSCLVQDLLREINTNSTKAPLKSPSGQKNIAVPSSLERALSSHTSQKTQSSSLKDETETELNISITTVKEVFTNLILAGTDTTATALTCLLLVLLHKPEVQYHMQEEVDRVVGDSRSPSLVDRPAMPYLEAVLMELLRYISHVPLAVPHYTTCDTSVLNMPVPANTTVYINLWGLHHDEKEWPDPWLFDPSRFLDSDGQLLPSSHLNRRKLLSFGAGRRVCLGEVLAKNRLFLFAAALVQKFHFKAEDVCQLPDVDPRTYEMGLVLHPRPYRLRALARSH